MNLLIIKDDKPGHYNQSEGIYKALEYLYSGLKVEYIEVKIKNKISRKILRFLLNHMTQLFKNETSLKCAKYFYKTFSIPQNKPNIIVSTGGNTANINAWLTLIYGNLNILNGALRGLNENLFTCITTVIDLGYQNQIILDMGPNVISKKLLNNKSKDFLQEKKLNFKQEYYTLLIGGDGGGYKYDNLFYQKLSSLIKYISETKNVQWLVTTSRRTPVSIEKELEKELKDYCAYFVQYNSRQEKVLLPFLGIATSIFVTEESATMISEAIATNKPVYTIGVENAQIDENYNKILKKFEKSKKIQRILADEKLILNNVFELSDIDSYKINAKLLKKFLNRNEK